jgi:NitT/TauT family transport system ATP-binding protein
LIHVSDLSYAYNLSSGEELPILEDISFNAERGSYTSIIGPSGCGKTTLLLCLSGLLESKEGTVNLGNLFPVEALRQHQIGFVFQRPVFFEWMNILKNIALPAKIAGVPDPFRQAHHFLEMFHLDRFANAYPHELSGGMLSRVAIARALVHTPRYLFLDEAFNYLDEVLRDEINMDIQEIWLRNKMSVIAITHSITEAVFMSDYILVMSQRPSSIIFCCQVPFERPRKLSIRSTNQFIEIAEKIRQALLSSHKEMNNG